MDTQFIGNWGDISEMARDFEVSEEELTDFDILVAAYVYDFYEGDSFVLLADRDGMLYEANGSHCSCYGLEGQWCPEPVNKKELRQRLQTARYGCLGRGDVHDAVLSVLNRYEQ